MAIRKNVNSLTAGPTGERAAFVRGVKAMKASGRYDTYVADHRDVMTQAEANGRNPAHSGPAFFPWHREFILRFERDLQLALNDPNFGLPYWDWAADAALPDPRQGSVWQADLMGGEGNPVQTGPFRQGEWTLLGGGSLVRSFGTNIPTLPTQADVAAAHALTVYDSAPWSTASTPSFRNQSEGWLNGPQMHNRVHVWVGGSMLPMTSPNDPVFFLHHCNVDRLWARWLLCSPSPGYQPASGGPAGHNLNDTMWPWNTRGEMRRPADVLDHIALGYSYDTETPSTQTITLRRTTGDRFVSDKVIEVTSPCDSRAETATTLFVPGRPGGRIRAQLSTMTDEVPVNR
ncbi:MAG: tyrosinase family protein [Pyrinomonadaceae bacterium]